MAEAASAFKRERGFRKGLTTGVAVMAVLFALPSPANVATWMPPIKDSARAPRRRRASTSVDLEASLDHTTTPLLAGRSGIPIASGLPWRAYARAACRSSVQDFDYNSIKSVALPPVDGVARGYTVRPSRGTNSTDLDLYLSLDRTLHIVGSMIFVSKTSETGMAHRRRMPIPFVVAGLIFVGSAVGSAVIGYYVEMGLDAIHGVGDDPDQ